jgi:hypothetical protein
MDSGLLFNCLIMRLSTVIPDEFSLIKCHPERGEGSVAALRMSRSISQSR